MKLEVSNAPKAELLAVGQSITVRQPFSKGGMLFGIAPTTQAALANPAREPFGVQVACVLSGAMPKSIATYLLEAVD